MIILDSNIYHQGSAMLDNLILIPYSLCLDNVHNNNDDHNDMAYVTVAVVMIAGVRPERAFEIMMEAHDKGVGLVCVTHKELAELKRDQLLSKGLTASIEAA